MNNEKSVQTFVIAALIVAIVSMSVGFANFTASLEINGTADVKAAVWSIIFDDETYAESTGSVAATSHSLDDTTLTYDIELSKPGDFYEATATIINDGTFDAKLTSITMSELTEAQQKYLKYTITYGGTSYTETTTGLSTALAAETGNVTVKVRVEYVQPDDADDLPATDVEDLSLTATFAYAQA